MELCSRVRTAYPTLEHKRGRTVVVDVMNNGTHCVPYML